MQFELLTTECFTGKYIAASSLRLGFVLLHNAYPGGQESNIDCGLTLRLRVAAFIDSTSDSLPPSHRLPPGIGK